MTPPPLILITNDDGIASPGLLASANALAPLGDLLIVAPHGQQTGAGRSFSHLTDHHIYRHQLRLTQGDHIAYSLKGSPAQAVSIAVLDLADRPIDLAVSGINFGANIGSGITISGTVGAALEAAAADIPALAVSQQTELEHHLTYAPEVDFTAAAHFTHYLAQRVLAQRGLPHDVDVLKVDVPFAATPNTPWRITRVSRQAYHFGYPAPPEKRGRLIEPGYFSQIDYDTLEPDSDIYALCLDKIISVSPLSLDMTARNSLSALEKNLKTTPVQPIGAA